ncbi:MAG: tetratricopeptide repeat-containing sensor histidine kinase [Bacteroidota bacterium]
MKVLTGILFFGLIVSGVWGQSPKHELSELERLMNTDYRALDSVMNQHYDNFDKFPPDERVEFHLLHLFWKQTSQSIHDTVFYRKLKSAQLPMDHQLLLLSTTEILDQRRTLRFVPQLNSTLDSIQHRSIKVLFYAIKSYMNIQSKMEWRFQANKAMKRSRKTRFDMLPSLVLNIISTALEERGQYTDAVKYQQKALNYAEKNELHLCVVMHKLKLADVHYELGNVVKAKSYYADARQMAKKIKNKFLEAEALLSLGDLNVSTGQIKEGLYGLQRALILYYQESSEIGIANTHKELGRAYLQTNDLELAEKNLELSSNYFDQIPARFGKGELHYFLAQLAFANNQLNRTLKHCNRALIFTEKHGSTLRYYKIIQLRSRVRSAIGDETGAYRDLRAYVDFKDSISASELQTQVAELSELYEAEQKAKQISEQKRRIEEQRNQQLINEQKLENTELRNQQIILILFFSVILFLALFVIFYFRSKQRALRTQQREVELQQQLLRSQMNPHFLFNAMSVIQSYIYDNDLKNSSAFLVNFSRLMRLILENSDKEFIPLSTELEILERFLKIQQARFEHRFDFEISAEGNVDLETTMIPPMVLQPFLENATEHGELHKVIDGKIRINYKIEKELLIFEIVDNGIGRKAAREKRASSTLKSHKSMAISITEQRIALLHQKYKRSGYVTIEDDDQQRETGTRVKIGIPIIQ